ncbi:transferrin-binding protein-like solute binding protein [Caulobacter sp. LARHSG274]
MRITAKILLMSAAAGALTACGGGGGGGSGPSGGVVTPPPVAASVLLAPMALAVGGKSGSTAASSANNFSITDPDTPGAATYSALKIDGDETIRIQATAGGATIDQTLAAADYKGEVRTFWGSFNIYQGPNSYGTRVLMAREWRNAQGSLQIIGLEEGDHLLGLPKPTNDLADAVSVVKWTSSSGAAVTGYGLLGDLASNIPTTGAARFRGEAIGYLAAGTGGAPREFVARAGLDVDFASATLRGGVSDLKFDGLVSPSGRYDFSYQGQLASGKFDTTQVDAPFLTGESGAVHGQLHGPANDLEVGGVFNLSFADSNLVGAFVAGHPSDVDLLATGDLRLRPSFSNLISGPGYTNAYYNQNDIELSGGASSNIEVLNYNPGGFVLGDESYGLRTNDNAYTLVSDFAASSYAGRETTLDYRPSDHDPYSRAIEADTWQDHGATLRRFSTLGVQIGGVWYAPALVQALEYVNPALSAGLEQRVYLSTGPHASTLPTSGVARYAGESIGAITDLAAGKTYRTASLATIDVLFATGEARGSLSDFRVLNADSKTNVDGLAIYGVTFAAPISQARFDATAAVVDLYAGGQRRTASGHLRGDFYGGSASELGGIYDFNVPGVAAAAGVFVAASNAFKPPVLAYLSDTTFSAAPNAGLFTSTTRDLTDLGVTWGRMGPDTGDDRYNIVFQNSYNAVQTFSNATKGSSFAHFVSSVSGFDFDYTSLLSWQDSSTGPTVFVALGQRTTDMPVTGSANYKGAANMVYATGSSSLFTTGKLAMTVDFASGALNGSITEAPTANFRNLDLTFNATVNGSQYAGQFSTTDQLLKGPMKGVFAGPGAVETAGTFTATTHGAGESLDGGFLAVKQ